MKKIYLVLCFVFLVVNLFAQKKFEKTNELGLFVSPGTYFVTAPTLLGKPKYNYSISFGAFYQQPLSPHFKWRLGATGTYEISSNNIVMSGKPAQSKFTTFILEIPLQFQYIFNPDKNLKFYTGLGIGIRREFYTRNKITQDGSSSEAEIRNTQLRLEYMPSLFVGMTGKINEYLFFYLQPEYRIAGIGAFGGALRQGINVQLGLIYSL
jgi:hypothetical protein